MRITIASSVAKYLNDLIPAIDVSDSLMQMITVTNQCLHIPTDNSRCYTGKSEESYMYNRAASKVVHWLTISILKNP